MPSYQTMRDVRESQRNVRVVFNALLGGWYVVRGAHQTPIGGRFDTRADAIAHLNRRK